VPEFRSTFRTSWIRNSLDASLLWRHIGSDEDPPILGNNTGSTAFNSGNTFPSLFDTMGRTYSINLKVTF
jgi:hypothetical protein